MDREVKKFLIKTLTDEFKALWASKRDLINSDEKEKVLVIDKYFWEYQDEMEEYLNSIGWQIKSVSTMAGVFTIEKRLRNG